MIDFWSSIPFHSLLSTFKFFVTSEKQIRIFFIQSFRGEGRERMGTSIEEMGWEAFLQTILTKSVTLLAWYCNSFRTGSFNSYESLNLTNYNGLFLFQVLKFGFFLFALLWLNVYNLFICRPPISLLFPV